MKVLFWVVTVILVFGFTTAFLNCITQKLMDRKQRYIDLISGSVLFALFVVLIIVFRYLEVI